MKRNWSKYICGVCGKPLIKQLDLAIYNVDEEGEMIKFDFRHQTTCDDKRFRMSRHVRDGVEDLLERRNKMILIQEERKMRFVDGICGK